MKWSILLFIASLVLLSSFNKCFGQYNWTPKGNFSGLGRAGAVAFSVDTNNDGKADKGYIGGGWNQISTDFADFWEYDAHTDSWAQKADIGGGVRRGAIGFGLHGKVYIGSGAYSLPGNYLQDFWQYDPTSNTWVQKNNLPGTSGRWGAIAMKFNNKAFFGLGNYNSLNSPVVCTDFWEYNDTADTWNSLASFPGNSRFALEGFVLDTSGVDYATYIGPGLVGTTSCTNDLWEYDRITNLWAQKSNVPGPNREACVAFTLKGKGYLGLGNSGGGTYFTDFYQYDPVNDSWLAQPLYPNTGRAWSQGFSIADSGYVIGGMDGVVKKDVYKFAPAISPFIYDTINATICLGSSYFGHSITGTYIDTFQLSAGHDSIRTLNLTVFVSIQDTVTATICRGTSYSGHSIPGTYIDTFNSSAGCDSIRILNLRVVPIQDTITATICRGTSYSGHSIPGTYIDTFRTSGGCDSIRVLNLSVALDSNIIHLSICPGASYAGYTQTGTYIDSFVTHAGCDSIRTLYLTVKPVSAVLYTDTACTVGKAWAEVTGGATPYFYHWSDPNHQTTDTATGLEPGRTYTVTITASGGCSYTDSVTINHLKNGLSLQVFSRSDSCVDSSGTVKLVVSGGAPGYTYSWNDGNNLPERIGLAASTYSVTVTDASGCYTSAMVVIPPADPPAISLTGIAPCVGDSNGNISVTVINGKQPFTYNWSNGQGIGNNITGLQSGTYMLTVTDGKGCQLTDTFALAIDSFSISTNHDTIIALGYSAPLQVLSAAGGIGALTYTWAPPTGLNDSTGSMVVATPPGTTTYKVMARDSNGCIAHDSVKVQVDVNLVTVPDGFTPNGDGRNDVFALITSPTVKILEFMVFNRWGQLLSADTGGWNGIYDGKPQPMDTYVYQATIQMPDGSKVSKAGSFILVR